MLGSVDRKVPAGAPGLAGDQVFSAPNHDSINEKRATDSGEEKASKSSALSSEIRAPVPVDEPDNGLGGTDSEDVIIITGADAAAHLLPLRDDGEPALTFRSLFLASCLACFQAVMNQIYQVRAFKRSWWTSPTCLQ